jgi:hypothetical protein
MKMLFFIFLMLPVGGFAQKYNFQGEYRSNSIENRSAQDAKDTVIESFIFRDDSVKMSYVVIGPKANGPLSKRHSAYIKWKITRQQQLSETDKATGKEIVYEHLDVTLSDGRTVGYFQHASSLDRALSKTLPQGLTFIHNGRKFLKIVQAR